jgi:hypothetical protein
MRGHPIRRPVLPLVAIAAAASLAGAVATAASHRVTVTAGLVGDTENAEAYMNANAPFVREVLPETIRDCALADPSHEAASFTLDVTVGEGGKVTAIEPDPSNGFTSCVADATKKHAFTVPPKVPSEVYIELKIE